ncbi:MAG: cysteine synthase, partial [Pseudomonadota bacterium]|nr:cysteine synthase [Pseudomonadota bacterium]
MDIYRTEGRGRLYNDIVETVGDTPSVRLNRTGPDHVSMFVKVESFNPLSSVKDRLALNIIES